MANYIDLHLHSTASDGSDNIPGLLEAVTKCNLHVFSLTDHDTIEGTLEMEKIVPPDIHFIRGIEFSCITPYQKCHILGYDFDPENADFLDALNLGIKLRQEKLYRRLAFFKEHFGFELTKEEADWLFSINSPGKPHFGKLFVNRGMAPDIRTAIEQYVKKCKDGNDRIDAQTAIQAILSAGGIPVWAHPLGGEGEKRLTREEFSLQLETLISYGIRGMECYYSRYEQDDIDFLVKQAQKHHLLISGGSDYHGKNKPDLHPGKLNAEDMDVDKDALTLYNYLSKKTIE